MIADTSFIIDVIRGDKKAVEKVKELEDENEVLKLSSATVFELYTGVVRSDKPEEEKEKILNVIDSRHIVEADDIVMERAGRTHGRLIIDGNRKGAFDCIIASTAQVHEETILTRNKKDFDTIGDVRVTTY